VTVSLEFSDPQGYADLATFVRRARAADADAAVRLVTRGAVLGVWAGVLAGSGLFATGAAVGHRGFALAGPVAVDCDVVVLASALTDRFARMPGDTVLSVPPATSHAPWAGQLPLAGPWERVGAIAESVLAELAADGIAAVARAVPDAVGSAAVDAVRHRVWAAPLPVQRHDDAGDVAEPGQAPGWVVPTGAAFAASVLGLLPRGPGGSAATATGTATATATGASGGPRDTADVAQVCRCGRWARIRLQRGHVFARA